MYSACHSIIHLMNGWKLKYIFLHIRQNQVSYYTSLFVFEAVKSTRSLLYPPLKLAYDLNTLAYIHVGINMPKAYSFKSDA